MSTHDKEKRAKEALIVSRLRSGCGDDVDLAKLPVLSEKEKASLKCLKPRFIQSIIEKADLPDSEDEDPAENFDEHNVCNRELVHGMNRADEIDDETEDELKRKRKEMQDKMREERDGG